MMKKILREPLIHFLLIGVVLFGIYDLINPSGVGPSGQQIVVTAGRIEQLATLFQKTWQRPPSDQELKGLIDDFLLEEVYYRQAVEMGIDRDDTVIRRRLRQKMEFLTDDSLLVQPKNEDLVDYLARHPEKFLTSPIYSFQQIYFNPEKHGETPEAYITEQLLTLQAGTMIDGDVSLLPRSFNQAVRQTVDSAFGQDFSIKLDALAPGEWHGPVRSGLGFHLIQIDTRTKGVLPDLDEIRPIVEREWEFETRMANRQIMNDELLEKYDVTIGWPTNDSATQSTGKSE